MMKPRSAAKFWANDDVLDGADSGAGAAGSSVNAAGGEAVSGAAGQSKGETELLEVRLLM